MTLRVASPKVWGRVSTVVYLLRSEVGCWGEKHEIWCLRPIKSTRSFKDDLHDEKKESVLMIVCSVLLLAYRIEARWTESQRIIQRGLICMCEREDSVFLCPLHPFSLSPPSVSISVSLVSVCSHLCVSLCMPTLCSGLCAPSSALF